VSSETVELEAHGCETGKVGPKQTPDKHNSSRTAFAGERTRDSRRIHPAHVQPRQSTDPLVGYRKKIACSQCYSSGSTPGGQKRIERTGRRKRKYNKVVRFRHNEYTPKERVNLGHE